MAKPKAKPPARGSKSDFIRGLPGHMPAKEVVAKAKDHGLVMTEKYVYKIRSASQKRAKARPGAVVASAKGKPGKRAAEVANKAAAGTMGAPRKGGSKSVEELLRAVASELGLSRAIAILEAEQRKVRALLAGQ